MSASKEFDPNSTNISNESSEPPEIGMAQVAQDAVWMPSRRGLWGGIALIVVLAAAGLGGQFVGLRTIESYTRIRGQLISEQADRGRLRGVLEALRSDVADTRANMAQLTEEESQLKQRVKEVRKSEELAHASMEAAQSASSKAVAQRQTAEAARGAALERRVQLLEEISDAEKKLGSLATEKGVLEGAVAILRPQQEQLNETLKQLATQTIAVRNVTQLANDERESLDALREQNSAIKRSLDQRKAEVSALARKADTLRSTKDNLRNVQKDLAREEQREKDLVASNQQLAKDEAAALQRLEPLSGRLENELTTLTARKARVKNLEEAEVKMTNQSSQFSERATAAKARLVRIEAEIAARRDDLSTVEERLAQKKGDLAQLLGGLESRRVLESALSGTQQRHRDAVQEYNQLEAQIAGSRISLSKIKSEHAQLSGEVEALDEAITRKRQRFLELGEAIQAEVRRVKPTSQAASQPKPDGD